MGVRELTVDRDRSVRLAHLSNERTARALGVSKGAVAKYLALANVASLNDGCAVRDLDEHALKTRLFPTVHKQADVVVPDFGRIHQELARKGFTVGLSPLARASPSRLAQPMTEPASSVHLAFAIRFIHHLRYRHILLYRRYPKIEGKLMHMVDRG